jgi:chromosome segregation ATPase
MGVVWFYVLGGAWGFVCFVLGAWLARNYMAEHEYVKLSRFEDVRRTLEQQYETLKQAIVKLTEDTEAVASEVHALRAMQSELERNWRELQQRIPEIERPIADLRQDVDQLRQWAESLAASSKLLVELEPVLVFLASGEASDRVSRRLVAKMTGLRAWHQQEKGDLGELIRVLNDLGAEVAQGFGRAN